MPTGRELSEKKKVDVLFSHHSLLFRSILLFRDSIFKNMKFWKQFSWNRKLPNGYWSLRKIQGSFLAEEYFLSRNFYQNSKFFEFQKKWLFFSSFQILKKLTIKISWFFCSKNQEPLFDSEMKVHWTFDWNKYNKTWIIRFWSACLKSVTRNLP